MRKRLEHVTEPAAQFMNGYKSNMIQEVESAVKQHKIVVIGMAQNPVVRKVRKVLKGAGHDFHYLQYGSYLSRWRDRLAIKIWSGWPLFPQVFVNGRLIGGCTETMRALKDGSLQQWLSSTPES